MLLIHKKRGFGAGKINGPGGKVDFGETPIAAAIRETQEETGVTPLSPELRGELWFRFAPEGRVLHCLIYVARDFTGQPTETDEAVPQWFAAAALPFEKMWEDDRYWLPLLLAEKHFRGTVDVTGEVASPPVLTFISNA